jgi:hypothetical protein
MTVQLRAEDLRGCDNCGGPIAPVFYRVTVEIGAIQPAAINRLIGTHQILGGIGNPGALAVANVLTGDEPLAKLTPLGGRALLCLKCFSEGVTLDDVPQVAAAGEQKVAAARAGRG